MKNFIKRFRGIVFVVLVSSLGLSMTACGSSTDNYDNYFVAVTAIENVPETKKIGFFTLSGTVVPKNATKQSILWELINPGETEAALDGNTIIVDAAGVLTVLAIVKDGIADGIDYIKPFNIGITDPEDTEDPEDPEDPEDSEDPEDPEDPENN